MLNWTISARRPSGALALRVALTAALITPILPPSMASAANTTGPIVSGQPGGADPIGVCAAAASATGTPPNGTCPATPAPDYTMTQGTTANTIVFRIANTSTTTATDNTQQITLTIVLPPKEGGTKPLTFSAGSNFGETGSGETLPAGSFFTCTIGGVDNLTATCTSNGQAGIFPSLAAGGYIQLAVHVDVDPSTPATGGGTPLSVTGSLSSGTIGDSPSSATGSVTVVTPPNVSLTVATPSPTSTTYVAAGSRTPLDLSVTNSGGSASNGPVQIVDSLSGSDLAFGTPSPTGGWACSLSSANTVMTCTISSLGAGLTVGVKASIEATSSPTAPLNAMNTAVLTVNGAQSGQESSNLVILVPPTTTIALSPVSPDGWNDWYRRPVAVTLSASDPDDTVAQTRCELDASTAPATFDQLPDSSCSLSSVSSDGEHTIYAASIDSNGNKETPVRVSFKIDRTPPNLAPTVSPTTIVLNQAGVSVSANATDTTSGVAYQSCGQIDTSTRGDHTVSCTATDNAGNTNSATVHYTVAVGGPTVTTSDKVSTKARGAALVVAPGIKVSCPAGGSPCTANEVATVTVLAAADRSRKRKKLVIGRADFTIPAGQSRQLTFKLNNEGARLLRKLGHLRMTVKVISRLDHDAPVTTTKTMTVRAPARKHHKHSHRT